MAYGGQHHLRISKEFIAGLLLYNLVSWAIFALVYSRVDFKTHFDVPARFEQTFDTTAYFSWQVQTQMYATDIIPKTAFGRGLVSVQGLLAWSQTIVFLAPFVISHSRK